ncbi:hypothetical protein [Fodinicola acaciae]|uniref:hypothetical protein n=1 Tax=Fodinicola acaciae TaxID=2681555 RepID=UPI0013D63465|nr:hypothetical protein [Fodinicola acaciae]
MTARVELTDRLLAALVGVPGLRPARPRMNALGGVFRTGLDALAVDATPEVVEVRLVAIALPLPPLLEKAAAALEPVVAASGYAGARLRLVVIDLDRSAFGE